MPLPPQREDPDIAAERLRREAVESAVALLEKNPDHSASLVQFYDHRDAIEREMPDAAKERLSEARFEYCTKLLDAFGKAFLPLVNDLESEKAYAAVIDDFLRQAWKIFSDFRIDIVPPILFYGSGVTSVQAQAQKLQKRAFDWVMEGHRRLVSLLAESRTKSDSAEMPITKTIGEMLDEAASAEGISHEEQAHQIGISRTTYFEVKAGRGGKQSRKKSELYLSKRIKKIGGNPD